MHGVCGTLIIQAVVIRGLLYIIFQLLWWFVRSAALDFLALEIAVVRTTFSFPGSSCLRGRVGAGAEPVACRLIDSIPVAPWLFVAFVDSSSKTSVDGGRQSVQLRVDGAIRVDCEQNLEYLLLLLAPDWSPHDIGV